MASIQQMIKERLIKKEPTFVTTPKDNVKIKVETNPKPSPKVSVKNPDYSNVKINVTTADKVKPKEVKKAEEPTNTLKGLRVSHYGPTGNPMASGKMPYEGAVATSWIRDKKTGKPIDDIPLGTKITIDGKEYMVEDRTAEWVGPKLGQTIDIFHNTSTDALKKMGVQKKDINIK